MSIQISRSAFRRVGDTINMKPGVDVLKVGTVDVTGITLDTDYAIDIASHLPVFKDNRSGEDTTKNFILDADIFDTGTTTLKTSILPSLAKILVSSSANQATRDLTTVQQGDIDIQQDNEIAYIYDSTSWQPLSQTPTTYVVDVNAGKLHLDVSEKVIKQRLSVYEPILPDIKSGYQKMYVDHVMQADKGADLDFLVGKRGSEVKRHSH